MIKPLLVALLVVTGATVTPVRAHSESSQTKKAQTAPSDHESTAFGRAGDPKNISRTINVDMHDTMRFSPDKLTIRQGETVRFMLRNTGKTMHEFVLGTLAELKSHAEMMKKHPGMEHDEPYMAHVAPGKTQTIIWQFTRPGEFHFGCLLPGHFEARMSGRINVTAR